ncbi:MAG: HAMP domain-containing histidine kinase, partial [Gemmatimonadota bacterium]|nr:HAMP domain-containing histidine kinase [Gemmatimonadota bacterium]
ADGSGNAAERQSAARPPSTPSMPVTGSAYVATHGSGVSGGVSGAYRPSFLQGLGIFSVSLGAVLLLFLAGLTVADRTLASAARSQAVADASEVAALLENFVGARVLNLRSFRGLFVGGRPVTRGQFTAMVGEMATPATGLQRVWVADSTGRIVYDTVLLAGPDVHTPPGEQAALIERARHARRAQVGRPHGTPASARSITLVEPLIVGGRIAGFAGGTLFASALPVDMRGEHQGTRVGVALIAARDTIATNGRLIDGPAKRLEERRVSGVPPWRVVVAHSEPSRYVRFALWSLGILAVAFLVTGLRRERRQAEDMAKRSAQLEQLYREVRDASRIKSEFLANVSHELRTPLNAIVGFVEMLRDGVYGELGPRQGQPVERIAASASHLRHLVDQILDIAKMAAGRLEVHPEPVVLRPFVLNIVSELESLINEKGLTLSITVGATLPRVRTDPTHLRQIVVNLVGNAVKYTASGGIAVRARLVGPTSPSRAADLSPPAPTGRGHSPRPEEEGSLATIAALAARAPRADRPWLALQVSDTGIGIAPEDQERIFEEFEQVNAGPRGDSMRRGTGLGLSISRRLARLLGAELTVESELGRGSTFTLWLPVDPADLETGGRRGRSRR